MRELLENEIFGEISIVVDHPHKIKRKSRTSRNDCNNNPDGRCIAIMDNYDYISLNGPTGKFIQHGISERRKGVWYASDGTRRD